MIVEEQETCHKGNSLYLYISVYKWVARPSSYQISAGDSRFFWAVIDTDVHVVQPGYYFLQNSSEQVSKGFFYRN
jgi:hypothetical protein